MSCALALHSCSDCFGLALLEDGVVRSAEHPLGRELSRGLLPAVEALLPAAQWPRLQWLAVATGPGGFTGTRLSVVLARTLAQQLQIPLWGWGSFELIARRRVLDLAEQGPLWIGQTLPRRGVVAGRYALVGEQVEEWDAPRLHPQGWEQMQGPCWEAEMCPERDAQLLLQLGREAQQAGSPGPWQLVLPQYPTSPVAAL